MNKKEKEARKLLRNGKFADALDKFNEAGHELHQAGKSEEAIELLEEGSKYATEFRKQFEGSLCERTLSEIHAERGNREQCLRHIVRFRKLAIECKSKSQEQLSYHVEAWCLQQLFLNGEAGRTDIELAIEMTKKSRSLVEMYKRTFKPDEVGGPAHRRTVDLFTLEAQLQNQLGNNEKAMKLLENTSVLIKKHLPNDKSATFEMLRTKCSIAPVAQRISIAELMDEDAPEDKKAQTLTELSHQYILGNMLERGYKSLAQAYILHVRQFGPGDLEETVNRLCIIYRLVKYTRILKNPRKNKEYSMCQLHEAIGDLYDKYYQTLMEKEKKEYRQFLKDNILKNYEKMLEFKRNGADALRAKLGIALVYWDLENYSKSKEVFEERLELLENSGASEDKILDTRVSIFNCKTKLKVSGLEKDFDELKKVVEPFSNTKRELYDVWANYLTDKNDDDRAKIWRDAFEAIPEVLIKNEDDETDFLFFRLPDDDILEKCREENEFLKLDSLTDYQMTKRNDKGETILHLAATKADNEAVVEKLCFKGCKVDARDHGGWTPLMEAVAHDQYRNVKVLIRYGADVNARSTESFAVEESQDSGKEMNHGHLTPLMDACTNGYVDIAKLLIEKNARVDLRDKSGWTAYQHLKQYIQQNDDASEECRKFAEELRKATLNYIPLVDIPVCNINTNRLNEVSDDSPPDEIEDGIILGMAASRKRKFSSEYENYRNSTKRQQRSGENLRLTPPPLPSSRTPIHLPKKRTIQPSISSYVQPRKIHRQNSSSSLHSNPRLSLSPRRSMSPAGTIRSAPSVYGEGDDDIQFVAARRSNERFDRPQISSIPSKVPSPAVVQQRLVPSPRLQIDTNSLDIIVKCCFQLPAGSVPDEIRPRKLPIRRTMTIAEVKTTVTTSIPDISQFKIKSVWNKDDKDKCGVDELTLAQVADEPNQKEVALVFDLGAPSAHEIYQEISKNPITEVTNRLKLLSTAKQLDLSSLLLNSNEMTEVTKTLMKCERPQNSKIDISFCELSMEDETNIQDLIEECSSLKLANTFSKSRFAGLFEKPKNRLEKLEFICVDFRDESQIIKILKSCQNLKTLNLSGIRVASNSMDSQLPAAIIALPHLVNLDLSFNPWISEQNWSQLLKGLEKLEELSMNETNCDVQFECDWLPHLSTFSARGSDLHWDSIFEMLSVSDRITRVDVRFSTIDSNLPKELQKGNLSINDVLY